MPPTHKRKNAEAAVDQQGDDDQPARQPAEGHQEATGGDMQNDRRMGMADVARRRAAHFANYAADEEEQDGAGNIHVGGNAARSLGMWSSAVQLVNAREEARQRRERQLMEGGGQEAEPAPSVQWAPSRDVSLGPRPRDSLPSLFDLAMQLVVEYIEDVETLWGIPDIVKSRIAAALCSRRRLSPSVLRLFTEQAPSEVSLPDCTQIDAACMADMLLACATTRLVKLELGLCGRSMTDDTAAAFAGACGGFPAASTLRLSGAYRLSDIGLLALLQAMPNLQELSLPQCSRLAGPGIDRLPQLVPGLRVLDLDECRGLGAKTLGSVLAGLSRLEAVILNGIPEVGDDLLDSLACCPQLQHLSLCNCTAVSDAGVTSIAAALPDLRELRLDDCSKITSQAIVALAKGCRQLQDVSLRRLSKVGEEAVGALAEGGTLRCLSLNGMAQLGAGSLAPLALFCKDSLQELDVSWCRKLPDEALGQVVDACRCLRRLSVWGCAQLTNSFLLGHSNDSLEVLGRGETLLPVPAA